MVYVGQFSQAVQLPSTTATPFTTVDGVPVAAVGLGLVLINGCQRDADGHQVCEDLQTVLSAWVVGSRTLMASETAALASSVAVSAAATAVVVGTQTVRMPPPAPVTTVAGVPIATKAADLPYSQDCYKESGYQYCRDVHATEFVVEDRTLTSGETTTVSGVALSAAAAYLVVGSETVGTPDRSSVTASANGGSTSKTSTTATSAQTTAEGTSAAENDARETRILMLPVLLTAVFATMISL